MKKVEIIRWIPRIGTLLFAGFLVILSFDVLGEYKGFWKISAALLMHNLPSFVLLAIVWLSWKREWIAGIFYPLLGTIYLYWAWGRFPLSVYFIIAGPLFLFGILSWITWDIRKKYSA